MTSQELANLSSRELQEYCTTYELECAEEEFWRALLGARFPDVLAISETIAFPDLEREERHVKRSFMPLRELYAQLLVVNENENLLHLVNALLNNEHFEGTEPINTDIEWLRHYHQILSFLLAHVSIEWFLHLVATRDPMVAYLPQEMQDFAIAMQDNELVMASLVDDGEISEVFDRYVVIQEPTVYSLLYELVDLPLRMPHSIIELYMTYATRDDDSAETGDLSYSSETSDLSCAAEKLLGIASIRGNVTIVRELLDDPRISFERMTECWRPHYQHPLDLAISGDSAEVVRLYLDHFDNEKFDNEGFFLNNAVDFGSSEVISVLLEDGRFDPNVAFNGVRPLAIAVVQDNLRAVQALLVDPRTNPFVDSNSIIRIAVEQQDPALLQLLLSDYRVVLSDDPDELVFWMLEHDVKTMLPLLVARNKDILQRVAKKAVDERRYAVAAAAVDELKGENAESE